MPVEMILKVTKAMKREEIGSVTLPSTPKFELHPVQNGFGASIAVVKKGKWGADDKNNVYNSDLSSL